MESGVSDLDGARRAGAGTTGNHFAPDFERAVPAAISQKYAEYEEEHGDGGLLRQKNRERHCIGETQKKDDERDAVTPACSVGAGAVGVEPVAVVVSS